MNLFNFAAIAGVKKGKMHRFKCSFIILIRIKFSKIIIYLKDAGYHPECANVNCGKGAGCNPVPGGGYVCLCNYHGIVIEELGRPCNFPVGKKS